MNLESLNEVTNRYRKMNLGFVAKDYEQDEENKIYEEVTDLICKKYGNFIKRDEALSVLKSKGKIYTMDVKKREGFYEYKTGNVGIPHFLRLTPTLMHELVHKLGYLQADESFRQMSNVFKEAGTELVSATSLSDKECRILIFKGVYSKFHEKTESNYLNVNLVNQINQAIGGNTLEKSIVTGKDYFKQAIIDRWGEGCYVNLEKNIEDIAKEEEKYWNLYEYISEDDKLEAESKLRKHIFSVQDTILKAEFDRRFEEVDSRDSAIEFLRSLKDFETNRIRVLDEDSSDRLFKDPGFEEIYNKYKFQLEKKYDNINIIYFESEWKGNYPSKRFVDEVSDEEKRQILVLASEQKKRAKQENRLSNLFRRLFSKQRRLKDINQNNEVANKNPKYESSYKVDSLKRPHNKFGEQNRILNDKSNNKNAKEKQDITLDI